MPARYSGSEKIETSGRRSRSRPRMRSRSARVLSESGILAMASAWATPDAAMGRKKRWSM
jgi:hypothetical protein